MHIRNQLSLFIYKIEYLLLRFFWRRVELRGHLCVHNLKITSQGRVNSIIAGKNVILKNCKVNFKKDGHKLILGDGIRLEDITFEFEKESSVIEIGNNSWLGEKCFVSAQSGCSITIKSKCVIAKNTSIRSSDSHIIRDNNQEIINKPSDIVIGNHVWIGENSLILKGAKIADNSIVGARSVVTASTITEENAIVVGQPARIIKRGVIWEL